MLLERRRESKQLEAAANAGAGGSGDGVATGGSGGAGGVHALAFQPRPFPGVSAPVSEMDGHCAYAHRSWLADGAQRLRRQRRDACELG